MEESPLTDTEQARRQGLRLKALRERLGVGKGRLMDALHLKTTNGYDMYERGQSVIRFDRVSEWATAFGISADDFWVSVMSDEGYDPNWNFRAELERVRPDDPEYVDLTYRENREAPQHVQRSVVETTRRVTEREAEIRRERSPGTHHSRAIAENRADYGARATAG